MRVECLAQGHNTLSQARALVRTVQSGIERTNQEATTPPSTSKHVTILVPTCYFQSVAEHGEQKIELGNSTALTVRFVFVFFFILEVLIYSVSSGKELELFFRVL